MEENSLMAPGTIPKNRSESGRLLNRMICSISNGIARPEPYPAEDCNEDGTEELPDQIRRTGRSDLHG